MIDRASAAWAKVRERTGLTAAGIAAVGAAVATILVAGLVFGQALDDVRERNGLAAADPAHLRFFLNHRPAALVDVAKIVTDLGRWWVLVPVAVLAGWWLWRRGQPIAVVVAPALALFLAASASTLVKAAVGRDRPPISVRLVSERNAAFPSGHATSSTATYLTIALLVAIVVVHRPWVRVALVAAALGLATAIGLTRLTLGVHWPTDVLAGWALGAAIAITVTLTSVLYVRLRLEPEAEPQAAP